MPDPAGYPVNRGERIAEREWNTDRVDNPRLWTPNIGYDLEFEGKTGPNNPPAGFVWRNQSTALFTQAFGAGFFSYSAAPGGVDVVSGLERAIPPGTWEMTAKMTISTFRSNWSWGGFYFADSSTGRLKMFSMRNDNVVEIQNMNSATSFNSESTTTPFTTPSYFRIRWNAANNVTYQFSSDGIGWVSPFSANDMTGFVASPDRFGIMTYVAAAQPLITTVYHWLRIRPIGINEQL